ncbi:MAG: sigma-70 family RNA polymerase sigma factor [Bacteroidales bacterium]|nr:sigma-70 family RNA polymerase sigma factor [Bacteroidales bacterium]
MHNTPDNILSLKIQEGSKIAFDSLFFKYYTPLYRFALNIFNHSTIAEESVHSAFIKIWKNSSKLNSAEEIGKLLFTYTKNEVIDEIRKYNTRKKHEEHALSEIIINEHFIIDDKCRVKAIIETAIEKLPKKSKEIFRLSKQEGLSNIEIANYLKLSKKTIENQLTIAYKKMRQYLEPYKNELIF